MKPSYLHNLNSSFYLWLDHEMLARGESYINYSGKLYNSPDRMFADATVYGSPFRQWVSDSSVPNVIIPSGIYNNGVYMPRGQSGLSIDFTKGRVMFPKQTLPNQNISSFTINTSFKEYNIYYTDEKEENLLFEKRYDPYPKVNRVTGALVWNDNPYPCIFFKNRTMQNIPFAFGGQDKTESIMRCIVLAENIYQLDSAISVMADSARKVFPFLPANKIPYNISGDFKSGNYYNYLETCRGINHFVNIDRVTVSKMSETLNKKMNSKLTAAIVDFELSDVRQPRVY